MSQLKKTALKLGVVVLVITGGYKWINQTPERAEATAVTTGVVVETTPLGKLIKQKVDPNNIPGVKAAGWMDNKTSFPAMLLLLVAGVMLSMMAFASPSSLSGGRH